MIPLKGGGAPVGRVRVGPRIRSTDATILPEPTVVAGPELHLLSGRPTPDRVEELSSVARAQHASGSLLGTAPASSPSTGCQVSAPEAPTRQGSQPLTAASVEAATRHGRPPDERPAARALSASAAPFVPGGSASSLNPTDFVAKGESWQGHQRQFTVMGTTAPPLPAQPSAATAATTEAANRTGRPPDARSQSPQSRRVAVFFGGPLPTGQGGTVTDELRARGFLVDHFDILSGVDLRNVHYRATLLRRIRERVWSFIFICPPCCSFCVALDPTLRPLSAPWGAPPPAFKAYVDKHNEFVSFTIAVLWEAFRASVAALVEHPVARSRPPAQWALHADKASIWDIEEMIEIEEASHAEKTHSPHCYWNGLYQKWTTFMGLLIRTGLQRELLSGTCDCVGKQVNNACQSNQSKRRWRIGSRRARSPAAAVRV